MTILKQLIENMIGDYLKESYDGYDLAEEVFDEVSEDTWEAIHEAILNELSPELLKRYKAAANRSYNRSQDAVDDEDEKPKHMRDKNYRDRHRTTMFKRDDGLAKVDKAIDRASAQKNKDARELSGAEFQRKYRMTKTAWKASNKK